MQSDHKDVSKQEADEKKRDINNKQYKHCKWRLIFALAISVVINVLTNIVIYFSVKEDRVAQYFCPDNWIGFQDKCYYFSEEEEDWNSSRYNCLSQNASLVMIATTKEKRFLKRFKCTSDHWIWQDMTENLTGQWVDENIHNKGYALMIFNEEQQQPLRELLEKSTHGHHDIMMSPTLNAGVRELQPLEDFYCFN